MGLKSSTDLQPSATKRSPQTPLADMARRSQRTKAESPLRHAMSLTTTNSQDDLLSRNLTPESISSLSKLAEAREARRKQAATAAACPLPAQSTHLPADF